MSDGTDHTFRFADRTVVHGNKEVVKGGTETFYGLRDGSVVMVHFIRKGSEDTADGINHISRDGLRVGEGTVKEIDRDAKKLTVTTAKGSEELYRLTDRAARDACEDIGRGIQRSEKVTVYHTEAAGQKMAHFFEKAS